MSAGLSGVGPISVRYAVQIRDLLHAQSIKRMAAEQESARAEQASRAAAARRAEVDALRSSLKVDEPKPAVRVDVKVDAKVDPAPAPAEAPKPVATADTASGQLVDISA
jgi:hypothetical protein